MLSKVKTDSEPQRAKSLLPTSMPANSGRKSSFCVRVSQANQSFTLLDVQYDEYRKNCSRCNIRLTNWLFIPRLVEDLEIIKTKSGITRIFSERSNTFILPFRICGKCLQADSKLLGIFRSGY